MAVLVGAILLLAACAVVGAAVLSAGGRHHTAWHGPAIGLATLISVSLMAIELPGRVTAAVVVDVVLVAVALAWLWLRHRPPIRLASLLPPLGGAGIGLIAACLPFISSGRIGLMGMSRNNDLSLHLLWVEGFTDPSIYAWALFVEGYPLGPHSLVAAITDLGGMRLDHAFQALLVAVLPMLVLAAGALAREAATWRRLLIAAAGGLAYLGAAFYGQGAFKELMLALMLLAFVAYARDVAARPPAGAFGALRVVLPGALLLAGAVSTFSYLALAWFGAFLGLWALATGVAAPWRLRRLLQRARLRQTLIVLGGTLLLLVVVTLPQLDTVRAFLDNIGTNPSGEAIPKENLGNLVGPLSGYVMFGIWPQGDFRLVPENVFYAGAWSAVAVGAVAVGGLIVTARRDLALPAAAIGCLALYLWSARTQSPYVAAKAQVIAAPVLLTLGLSGLLGYQRAAAAAPGTAALRIGFGLLVAVAALVSSSVVLRSSPVAHEARDLRSFAKDIGNRPTLYFGVDDFASAEMLGTPLASPAPSGVRPLPIVRSDKSFNEGQPLDWDSFTAEWYDRFDFVVTSDGHYTSEPPPNFVRVRHKGLHELYERRGPTPPRSFIDASGAPGAVLDCRSKEGRRIAQQDGVAAVIPAPIGLGSHGPVAPGTTSEIPVALPPGKWDLSAQYVSPVDVRVATTGIDTTLPPYLGRVGPFFDLGTVTGRGTSRPLVLTAKADKPSILTPRSSAAAIPSLVATSAAPRRMVPLRQACGKYVDWYRLEQPAQ